MNEYDIRVINNGVDTGVFMPIDCKHEIKKMFNIPVNDFIILGVSFGFGKKKGLDVFINLSRRLPNNFHIVLVGSIEKEFLPLPKNIISISRTSSQYELAKFYSAADLFVNPTREEVFGLVNIEALACGTPVLTFDTGGSPECIDNNCGSIVERDDFNKLYSEIIRICNYRPYSSSNCVKRAKEFDVKIKYKEYLDLFEQIGQKR